MRRLMPVPMVLIILLAGACATGAIARAAAPHILLLQSAGWVRRFGHVGNIAGERL